MWVEGGQRLIGDGTTDDSVAFAALISAAASGSTIYVPEGTYLINTGVSINKPLRFVGEGATFKTTANIQILTFTTGGEGTKFSGINFLGNDTGTGQIALYFNGCGRFSVTDCEFKNFGGSCTTIQNIENEAELGGIFSGCRFISNINIAIDIGTRGEYVQIIGCDIISNGKGIRSAGGNLLVSSCNIAYNSTGIEFITGANNAHSIIANCQINHNTTYGLYLHDSTLGVTISGCHIYQNIIYVKNFTGVNILGGIIDVNEYRFENSVASIFNGVRFSSSYTNIVNNNYNSTTSTEEYINCRHLDGRVATDPDTFV